MKKIITIVICLIFATPTLTSCSASRQCKTSKYKKKMYTKKCWNAKRQKYTRCRR